MQKIKLSLVLLAVTIIFYGTAFGKTYKIATVPWVGWSAADVAEAKGFWKAEGVDVQVVRCADPIQAQTLFDKRLVELKFDMIGSAMGLFMKGSPVKVIAETDWSHGGDKIIVKKDLKADQLKGKPVGVYLNEPSVLYFLDLYLATIGLKIADVRIVEMEVKDLADKFIQGLFQVIVCYDPESIRAMQKGAGKLIATSADYKGCIPEGLMIMDDILQKTPVPDLEKILKGLLTAVKWLKNPANWKEYLRILNTHTFKNEPPYPENELKTMLDAVAIHDREIQLARNMDGGGLFTYLNNLKNFLKTNNLLKKNYQSEKIFDNRFIIKVLKNDTF